MNQKVSVIIPIYQSTFSANELIVFQQGLKILSSYPIVIIAPDDLILPENIDQNKQLRVIRFAKKYFADIAGYNKLLLSLEFYQRFIEYEYILIYQLDAYVFRDELAQWCDKNYDYIGAPWVSQPNGQVILTTGNGGFSLRRVATHVQTLKKYKVMDSRKDLIKTQFEKGFSSTLNNLFDWFPKLFGRKNNSKYFIRNFMENEDYFWSYYAPQINPKFKVASGELSYKFAFEKEPTLLYNLNQQKLPFGCHAWEKYEPDFWNKHINRG